MSFRSILDSLTGKTYSSRVSIVEKTHFDGWLFQKVIDVKESAEQQRKLVESLNKAYSKDNYKPDYGYRFNFTLNFNANPTKISLRELAKNAFYDNYYTAHVETDRGGIGVTLTGPDDDGRRTSYLGYKLCNWLCIEPHSIIDGEMEYHSTAQSIKIFPVTYHSIHEVHRVGNVKPYAVERIDLFNGLVTVPEHKVDSYLRTIVRWETNRFVTECSSIMSPAR